MLGGGVGLATGLVVALFPWPPSAAGCSSATGTGALLGSVAGHAAAGMRRKDLKELGEALDEGTAGLVVVGVADTEAKIEVAMKHAKKIEKRELKADTEAIEADAKEFGRLRSASADRGLNLDHVDPIGQHPRRQQAVAIGHEARDLVPVDRSGVAIEDQAGDV